MKNRKSSFTLIARDQLSRVNGGSARVSASSQNSDVNAQLQLMLTQIGDSIKDIGKNQNNSSDQMMPMMMMMMMMGGGSSGGGAAAAPPPPPPPPSGTYVKVNVRR